MRSTEISNLAARLAIGTQGPRRSRGNQIPLWGLLLSKIARAWEMLEINRVEKNKAKKKGVNFCCKKFLDFSYTVNVPRISVLPNARLKAGLITRLKQGTGLRQELVDLM